MSRSGTTLVKPVIAKLLQWTFINSAVRGVMASSKSRRWVRLVVPTSRSLAPARAMMSGTRNAPPISTSSPRETITSLRCASALSVRNTPAALLLTMVQASAPVSSRSRPSTRSSRSPRRALSRSNSRLHGMRIASLTASMASSGSSARPRLVCSTVPVRLNSVRSCGRARACRRAAHMAQSSASVGKGVCTPRARTSSSSARSVVTTLLWPWAASTGRSGGERSSRPTAGSACRDGGDGTADITTCSVRAARSVAEESGSRTHQGPTDGPSRF